MNQYKNKKQYTKIVTEISHPLAKMIKSKAIEHLINLILEQRNGSIEIIINNGVIKKLLSHYEIRLTDDGDKSEDIK